VVVEVYLGTNEAMRPVRIDEISMAEERGNTASVSAADEDDRAGRMRLQIECEIGRKRSACWGAFGARCVPKSSGYKPSVRALLKFGHGCMFEAMPDLRLPAAVEAFDSILKPRFARRRKDRSHPKQQASSNDLTNGVRVLMRALKNERIVELCVRGKTGLSLSTCEQLDDVGRTDRKTWPAGDNTPMHRNAGEDGKLSSSSQNQAFNGIERIELATSGCNLGKVPADRRRWSTGASSCIKNTPALEDATDGTPRKDWSNPLLEHRCADRIRSRVSQIADSKLAAQPQNLVFSRRSFG